MSDIMARIAAAYEKDQRRIAEPLVLGDLPLSYEALTDAWLSDILCKQVPDAEVIAHRLSEPDTGSSNRRKIALEYNQAGRDAGLPASVFCKATHDLANRVVLGVSGGAHCEAEFYSQVRPQLNIEAPVCYFARVDAESFNSMIVLGDLSASVTEFCSHKTQMTLERARSQVDLLAKLHGACHVGQALHAKLSGLPTWFEYFTGTLDFGMKDGSNKGFLAGEEVIPARLFTRYGEIWPATEASVQAHQNLPATLSHGDVHLKNWYVAGSGAMGLSDWQCCSRGHWGRDLAYTMTTALTVENRRAWERELVQRYLENLQRAGGPTVSFDVAWNHYRQQMMSALTWWTITLSPAPGMPDMQPRDITLEFVRRISTAIDDLDVLDLF